MTDKTIMADKRFAPSGRLNTSLTVGTTNIIPMSPYTTEGMPAKRSTAELIAVATGPFAFLDMNIAHISPIGTPMRIAPNVPYTDERINGSIPY